jgi:hypothetical protein
MNSGLQVEKTSVGHMKGNAEGKTRIDWHFAIVHKESGGPGPAEMNFS